MQTTKKPFYDTITSGPFQIRFPKAGTYDQNEEWCEVKIDGTWTEIRFHDYHQVFQVPGLYETLFYRTLQCVSPTEVIQLLRTVLDEEKNFDPKKISALDLGAGNGMAAEALQVLGVRKIIGSDILEQAKVAALRDRPWAYNDYVVGDFTKPSKDLTETINAAKVNLLVTVAALGYGDIPAKAFYNAYNFVEEGGWVAFNIKEDFLKASSKSGFSGLINRMLSEDILRCHVYRRYRHRLNIRGEDLYYIALVGKKLKNIPKKML